MHGRVQFPEVSSASEAPANAWQASRLVLGHEAHASSVMAREVCSAGDLAVRCNGRVPTERPWRHGYGTGKGVQNCRQAGRHHQEIHPWIMAS